MTPSPLLPSPLPTEQRYVTSHLVTIDICCQGDEAECQKQLAMTMRELRDIVGVNGVTSPVLFTKVEEPKR